MRGEQKESESENEIAQLCSGHGGQVQNWRNLRKITMEATSKRIQGVFFGVTRMVGMGSRSYPMLSENIGLSPSLSSIVSRTVVTNGRKTKRESETRASLFCFRSNHQSPLMSSLLLNFGRKLVKSCCSGWLWRLRLWRQRGGGRGRGLGEGGAGRRGCQDLGVIHLFDSCTVLPMSSAEI